MLGVLLQLHVWDESYDLISHLSYVPASYEEVAMLRSLEASTKLLAQNRRDYQEFCKTEYEQIATPTMTISREAPEQLHFR